MSLSVVLSFSETIADIPVPVRKNTCAVMISAVHIVSAAEAMTVVTAAQATSPTNAKKSIIRHMSATIVLIAVTVSKNRYIYSAKFAQAQSDERLSLSRKGVRIDEKEIEILNAVLEKGIRKGQPLAHIYTRYKCTQLQRKIETKIRKLKDRKELLKAAGDEVGVRECNRTKYVC